MRTAPVGLQEMAWMGTEAKLTRNAERGMRNRAKQLLDSGQAVPRSAFRVPRLTARIVPMNYETLLFQVREHIAFLTINRPDKLNALNNQVIDELASVVQRIAADDSIRGVILTGAGEK